MRRGTAGAPLGSPPCPAATCARGVPPTTCGRTSPGSAQSSTSPSASRTTSRRRPSSAPRRPLDTARPRRPARTPARHDRPARQHGSRPGDAPGADGGRLRRPLRDRRRRRASSPPAVAARTRGLEARHHRLLPGHRGAALPARRCREGAASLLPGPDAAGDRLHDPARRRGRAQPRRAVERAHGPQHREARLRRARDVPAPGGDRPAADRRLARAPGRGQPERPRAGGRPRPRRRRCGYRLELEPRLPVGGLERRDLAAGGDGRRRHDGAQRGFGLLRVDGRRRRLPGRRRLRRAAHGLARRAGRRGRALRATSPTGSIHDGRATPRCSRRRAA